MDVLFGGRNVSFAVFAGYYLYNQYLNEHYNSTLFIATPAPFESLDDFKLYWSLNVQHSWLDQYFVLPSYLFYFTIICAAIPVFKKSKQYTAALLLSLLFFVFMIPVFIGMGHQYHVHDYYVICTFFPLLAWIVVHASIAIHSEVHSSQISGTMIKSGLIGALFMLYCFADFSIYQRLDINSKRLAENTRVHWMKGGAAILDSLHIPQNEKIVVINEYPPNQGLLYFDRKGYNIFPGTWKNDATVLEQWMKEKKLRIGVCETKTIKEKEQADSLIFQHFIKIYSDDRVTVLQLKAD